jgi:hypothetical protein
MKASRCRFVLLAFCAVVAVMIEPCCARGQSLTPEALTNFQWFSTLGFPDVKGCPLVRVATGRYSQTYDAPPTNSYLTAYVLATNASSFNVVETDLLAACRNGI